MASIKRLVVFVLLHFSFAIVIGAVFSQINGRMTPLIAEAALVLSVVIGFLLSHRVDGADEWKEKKNPFWETILKFSLGGVVLIHGIFILFLKKNAWFTLEPNNFGDLPLHIQYIRTISQGGAFWPDNPIFAGVKLNYPLGMDIYSALWDSLGVPIHLNLRWTFLVLGFALIYLLYQWGGWLLLVAFFFNNGLSDWPLGIANVDEIAHWKSFFLSLFVPQRGFQLGFPLGIFLLWQWKGLFANPNWRAARFVGVFLLGVLPLVHFHTFLFILGFLFFQWIFIKNKSLLANLALASLIFVPLTLFLTGFGEKASSIGLLNGWMKLGWKTPLFWAWSLGPWFFLLIMAFVYNIWNRELFKNTSLIFAVLVFLTMNVVTVAYWEWDNIKILSWAFLLWIWSVRSMVYAPKWNQWALTMALILSIGGLSRLGNSFLGPGRAVKLYESEDLNRIKTFLESTEPDDVFVVFPGFRHPVSYFGKPILMGYEGHLWSHGLDSNDRKRLLVGLYNGDKDQVTIAKSLGVKYIYWGTDEKRIIKKVNRERFGDPVFKDGKVEIFHLD